MSRACDQAALHSEGNQGVLPLDSQRRILRRGLRLTHLECAVRSTMKPIDEVSGENS